MSILQDILSTLKGEVKASDMRQGVFWTAVTSLGCGLASTPNIGHQHGVVAVTGAGSLVGRDALELARLALSPSPYEAAIGLAAMNSLLEVDADRCITLNAADILAERGEGKRIAIVGHFPFVPRLRQAARELWVLEQRPQEGDLLASEAAHYVPQADVVGITGSAFINHTSLLSRVPS